MDYIDIPNLQKRGILKKEVQENQDYDNDYVNLNSTQQESQSTNPLAFLDTFASSASQSSNTSSSNETNFSPSVREGGGASTNTPSSSLSPDLADLNVKIENFEYKLDRLVDKLAIIESKLEEVGGKVT